ncbi:MAG: SpoVR family protein [Bacteroidales bacterium]|nr:SpoVR family protein [Bacteroidales bacterium]
MEECKVRARAAGLKFDNESLEYIVSNIDMLELHPKVMIPTLYDYWVNDVEVLKEKGKYSLYPNNPYETVINSRPAISFYNDNNPDWMNIMIFYHVLAHIDCFQNNVLFEKTWNDDFVGQALADKRLVANLRSEHGRWLDYAIEFSRNVDNLTGYFKILSLQNFPKNIEPSAKAKYYFATFLQEKIKMPANEIYKEVEKFNNFIEKQGDIGETMFFTDVKIKHPEFQALYERFGEAEKHEATDVMEFIKDNSPFLKKDNNSWMKSVMSVVRNTALYFAPQIRTKILNEGWASYWHDRLFISDDRIKGHEINYAKLNAGVTSLNRIGLNPYAIGLRLIQYIEMLADKGKLDYDFQKLEDIDKRGSYDKKAKKGNEAIFEIRKNFSDFMLINTFINQDFVDMHGLFVVGIRYNPQRNTNEYYIKSRKAADYKKMLLDSLYHPPYVTVNIAKTSEANLYLEHKFEGKQLINEFISDTMLGISYLWGSQVQLETTEIVKKEQNQLFNAEEQEEEFEYRKVLYTYENKSINKVYL